MSAPRPLPVLTPSTAAFWTRGEHGELCIYRCRDCGYYVHPPAGFCPRCEGRDVAPATVSGRATVVSCTVNHQQWEPGLPVPYVLALVEIEEQSDVRLVTNIVGCPVDEVHIGMRVRVLFEQQEDVWVPLFEPDPAR
ncbi:MAG TPA: OB-fold domain-containing protein [Amycolatopsis sp.]|nr:OB-fold domain-containing protein [Amycolatopsis sp.]